MKIEINIDEVKYEEHCPKCGAGLRTYHYKDAKYSKCICCNYHKEEMR